MPVVDEYVYVAGYIPAPTVAVAPPASVAPAQVKDEPVKVVVVAMLFPADPGVLSVTVTTAPLAVAVTAATLALIAAARFVASLSKFVDWVVLSVLVAKSAPEVVPTTPPVRLPLKAAPERSADGIVVETLIWLPANPLGAVRITIPVPPLVVTPTGVSVIAVLMLVATAATVAGAFAAHHTKFGLTADPFDPAVRVVTVILLVALAVAVIPVVPAIFAVTSTSGLVWLITVAPAAGWLAVAPHSQVDVLEPVFAAPVVIASASQVTMLLVVALVMI